MGLDHPLAHAALREVVGLHAFFEAWLGGTAENTHAVFSRLESSLGEEFTMVNSSPRLLSNRENTACVFSAVPPSQASKKACRPTTSRSAAWARGWSSPMRVRPDPHGT